MALAIEVKLCGVLTVVTAGGSGAGGDPENDVTAVAGGVAELPEVATVTADDVALCVLALDTSTARLCSAIVLLTACGSCLSAAGDASCAATALNSRLWAVFKLSPMSEQTR